MKVIGAKDTFSKSHSNLLKNGAAGPVVGGLRNCYDLPCTSNAISITLSARGGSDPYPTQRIAILINSVAFDKMQVEIV